MLKFLVTGLVATLACAALACSGGSQGPTESDPNTALASQGDPTLSGGGSYYHTCSGSSKPCSEQDYESIVTSASYNPKTGTYKDAMLNDCTLYPCGGPNQAICNPDSTF